MYKRRAHDKSFLFFLLVTGASVVPTAHPLSPSRCSGGLVQGSSTQPPHPPFKTDISRRRLDSSVSSNSPTMCSGHSMIKQPQIHKRAFQASRCHRLDSVHHAYDTSQLKYFTDKAWQVEKRKNERTNERVDDVYDPAASLLLFRKAKTCALRDTNASLLASRHGRFSPNFIY